MREVVENTTSAKGRPATAGDALRTPRSDDAPTDRNGTPIPDRQGVSCRACGQVGVQTRQEYDLNPKEPKA